MDKIPFVDGTKTQEAYVTINEQNYPVTPAVWTGTTPVSAFLLNKLQDNVENAININSEELTSTGLGEGRTQVFSNAELNNLGMFNGFAYVTSPKINGETFLGNGYLFQLCYAATYKIQIFARASTDDSCLYVRRMINNSWEDFAPICERITEGEEEPTNKFIDNKRVYVKRIDCGNLPNSATKTIAHGLSNVKIEHFEGIMRANMMQTFALPHVDTTATNSVRVQLNSSVISIATARDWSHMTATIDIYYTKN